MFAAGFVFMIGMAFLYRMPSFREGWDRLVVRIPLFGSLIRKASIARFTRTLATLVSSGVPLLNCFDICVRLTGNFAIRDILKKTSLAVQEGKSIAQGLALGGDLFPPMVIHMVNIGEMSGKLDELLNKVADIYDEEVDDAVGAVTSLLQPALIVIVGALIAFLLIAMYLPIFQLAEKVTGG
jgi:type IV pilus assembly protein PilC